MWSVPPLSQRQLNEGAWIFDLCRVPFEVVPHLICGKTASDHLGNTASNVVMVSSGTVHVAGDKRKEKFVFDWLLGLKWLNFNLFLVIILSLLFIYFLGIKYIQLSTDNI